MKKTLLGLVLVAVAATSLFAAGARETVKIEGKLAFNDTVPTIVSTGTTWVLPYGPFYQIAYENNIKAGDTIKAEGFEAVCRDDIDIKDAKMFMPTKVSVNGKELDLSKYSNRGMMGDGRGQSGKGRGMMGDGFRGNNKR